MMFSLDKNTPTWHFSIGFASLALAQIVAFTLLRMVDKYNQDNKH
jgi:hypothetical protein